MLELIVNGQNLDLSPDIQINLTIENPFMLKERIPSPYSLSFDLPPTPKNLKIFSFPNRVAAYRPGQTTTLPCDIFFDGIRASPGFISVTRFDKTIQAAFNGAEITDSIRKAMYSTSMDMLQFTGGSYAFPDFYDTSNYAYKYKKMALDATNGLNDKFVVAPIRVKTDLEPIDFITESQRGGGPVLRNREMMMDSEYFNFFNPDSGEFMLNKTVGEAGERYAHAGIFPLLRVHYIFDKLFGDLLENNIFNTGELKDLVVPSTYFANWSPRNRAFPEDITRGMLFNNNYPFQPNPFDPPGTIWEPNIRLNTFLPIALAAEFIKQVLNLFSATLVARNGKFEIRRNDDIISQAVTESWESKIIGEPGISIEKSKNYKYGYSGFKSFVPPAKFTSVSSIKEMALDTPSLSGPDVERDRNYYVTSTGQYFEQHVELSTDSYLDIRRLAVTYKLLNDGLGGFDDDRTDEFDVTSELKPLPMYPEQYWWTTRATLVPPLLPELAWWFLPRWEGERSERPENLYIMIYNGYSVSSKDSHFYPYLTPYSVRMNGSSAGALTLAWDGPNGLISSFHSGYKSWIEKDKVRLSGSFLLSPLDLHNLDITEKKHLHGRNFFIEKIQVTFRHNRIDPAVVDFIEV